MSDEEARAAVRRIAGSLQRGIIAESIGVGILIAGVLSLFAGLLIAAYLFAGAPGLLMASPSVIAVMAILTGIAGGYLGAARHYDRMMQFLLSTHLPPPPNASTRARCPQSSYPLVKLRETTDGSVTCPECGLVSRISST